jgi:hypothetical protein
MIREDALAMIEFLPELTVLKPVYPGLTEEQAWRVIRRLAGHAMPAEEAKPGLGRCLVWDGNVNNYGYGRMNVRLNGKHTALYVHIVAWRLANGGKAVPYMNDIDHKCDVAGCFNPRHLAPLLKFKNYRRAAINTNRKRREAATAGTEAMQW